MKLLSYYIQILLPIPILIFFNKVLNSPVLFFSGLILYAVVYRGLIDGYRLQRLGILAKKDFWKMFTPFHLFRVKYFTELYFQNK